MSLYRIVYPPEQDTFGWEMPYGSRVSGPVPWSYVLCEVPALIAAGVRPVRVVRVPDTATRWAD